MRLDRIKLLSRKMRWGNEEEKKFALMLTMILVGMSVDTTTISLLAKEEVSLPEIESIDISEISVENEPIEEIYSDTEIVKSEQKK